MSTLEPLPALSPLCRHLRTKRMYVANSFEVEALAADEVESAYGHCWCSCTMFEIGPDDARVRRDQCRPGRDCYEAA